MGQSESISCLAVQPEKRTHPSLYMWFLESFLGADASLVTSFEHLSAWRCCMRAPHECRWYRCSRHADMAEITGGLHIQDVTYMYVATLAEMESSG